MISLAQYYNGIEYCLFIQRKKRLITLVTPVLKTSNLWFTGRGYVIKFDIFKIKIKFDKLCTFLPNLYWQNNLWKLFYESIFCPAKINEIFRLNDLEI